MKKGKPLKRQKQLQAKSQLKSNKQLKQKTQLKGNSSLRSSKPLEQHKQLRPRSNKAQQLYKDKRVPLVKRLLAERPWCEACPVYAEVDQLQFYRIRSSVDLHEMKSRGRTGGIHGEEWLDETNILCVCRECHRRITDFPEEAEALGLLKSGGLDND
jgi:hypothetical protein